MPYLDIERRRAYGRAWITRNKEKARDAMRRWRSRHREDDRSNKRDYYARNRDRVKAAVLAYRRRNPEIVRVVRTLRRARELAAEGHYSLAEWLALLERYGIAAATAALLGSLNLTIACRFHAEGRIGSRTSFRRAGAAIPASGRRRRLLAGSHHVVEEAPDEQHGSMLRTIDPMIEKLFSAD